MKVTFNDPSLFISQEGLLMESQKVLIKRALPSMAPSEAIVQATLGASSSAKSVVMGNLFFNIAL